MTPGLLALLLAAAPVAEYRVIASPGARVLSVEAKFPPGLGGALAVDSPVAEYVQLQADAGALPVLCAPTGCVVHYRFRLFDAAQELKSRTWAFADGEGLYAAPSSWLLRPNAAPAEARFRLVVETPKGTHFVTGLRRGAGPDSYEAPLSALEDAPWSGFAPFEVSTETIGAASIETAIAPGALALTPVQLRAWVARSASLVARFYGAFPVKRVAVMVLPGDGDSVGFGTAMGNGGAAVLVWVGAQAGLDALAADWVLPHELIHFSVPSLPRENTWLEEGIATYVEPLARVRAGELSADDYWLTLIGKLPLGQPQKGDQGMDHTPTWGRTYWGGAMFCFVADVQLREKSKNQQSLDSALKGIIAAGGTQEVKWELKRLLSAGDAATGLAVLVPLHASLGAAPGQVNLAALFKKLGVGVSKGRVVYDDSAPLASVRKAMLKPFP